MSHANTSAPGTDAVSSSSDTDQQVNLSEYSEHGHDEDESTPPVGDDNGRLEHHVQAVKHAFEDPLDDGNVVNVNVTITIGSDIDVGNLAADFEWAEPGSKEGFCELSFEGIPGQAKLYNTGTVVVVGVTDEDTIIALVERLHKELRQIGVATEWGVERHEHRR